MLFSVLATIGLTSFLAFSAAVDAVQGSLRLLALSFVGLRVIVHDFHGDTVQVR